MQSTIRDESIQKKKILLSIGADKTLKLLEPLRKLEEAGWDLYATEGTHAFLSQHGIASRCIYKASEKIEPNATTLISNRAVDLIINIPKGLGMNSKSDGFTIRRLSIDHHIPLITNMQIAQIFLQCLIEVDPTQIPVISWKELVSS